MAAPAVLAVQSVGSRSEQRPAQHYRPVPAIADDNDDDATERQPTTHPGYFLLPTCFVLLLLCGFVAWQSTARWRGLLASTQPLNTACPSINSTFSPSSSASATPRGGPRVMVVMSDNRLPKHDQRSDYSLTAFANYQWAQLQGYGFSYRTPRLNLDVVPAEQRHNETAKDTASCYNAAIGRYRCSSWCKVLGMAIAMVEQPHYDWYLFLDSDALINNYAIALDYWLDALPVDTQTCNAAAFKSPSSNCSLLFMVDKPYHDDKPNAGVWMVKRSEAAWAFLQRWWNTDKPDWDFAFPMEQNSLWDLQPYWQSQGLAGLVPEPSMDHRSEMQLLHHITSWSVNERLPYFSRVLQRVQHDRLFEQAGISTNFSTVIDSILAQHVHVVDESNSNPWPLWTPSNSSTFV